MENGEWRIDIQQYLQLAKVTNKLPNQDFWTAYDSEAADDSFLTDDDIIIRYDRREEIIGITILHASKR